MKTAYKYIAALITLLPCFGQVNYGQAAQLDPQTILNRVIARYESVSSYYDSGIVTILPADTLVIAETKVSQSHAAMLLNHPIVSFKTYYSRPYYFRFEWKGDLLPSAREAVIWSGRREAYSWMPNRSRKTGGFILINGSDLGFYMGEAVRSSGGAVSFVPSLLLKDAGNFSAADMLNRMTDLEVPEEQRFDGEICYIIRGSVSKVPWVLWIGKESYLLRKTRTLYTSGAFHELNRGGGSNTFMAEEIHRDIRINQKIPNRVFNRRPRLKQIDIDLTR